MLRSWLRLLFLRRLARLIRLHPGLLDLLALFEGVPHRVLGALFCRGRLAKREKGEGASQDDNQEQYAPEW